MDAAIPIFVAVLGSIIAWAALPSTFRMRWPHALVLGPAIGFAVLSMAIVASFRLGLGFPSRWGLWAVMTILAAGGLVWRLRGGTHKPSDRRPWRTPSAGEIALVILLLLSIGLTGYRVWVSIHNTPLGIGDSIGIWNGRANFIYQADDQAQELFRNLKQAHPDYPLFLSGSIAALFKMAGHDSLLIPQATTVILSMACVGALGLLLLGWAGRGAALFGCSVLLVTPAFAKWAGSQNSDIAMGYLALVALGALLSQFDDRDIPVSRFPPMLTGFFVGLLAWTKDEGIILMCAMLGGICVAWLFNRDKRLSWKHLGFFSLGMAIPLSAMIVFKLTWVTTSQIGQVAKGGALVKLLAWERYRMIADAFLLETNPIREARAWGVTWIAMGLLAVWGWRRLWAGPAQRFATTTIVLAFIGYFAIYLITPQELDWHLKTSTQRLFLQLLPLTMAWIGVLYWQNTPPEPSRKPDFSR